jgi:hypothetical protein
VIAYMAHVRHDAEIAARMDYAAFSRDPSVTSAVFLTPALAALPPAGVPRQPYATTQRFFSLRLATELGVSAFIMRPTDLQADILAADLLTNQRNRPLWEDAAAVSVKIDAARPDSDALKEFRGWCENSDIVDELVNSNDAAVAGAFLAFVEDRQPYQRPLAAPDFADLYALVQPMATEVERSATATGLVWAGGPPLPRDSRSTEQLKADFAKLLEEALAHDDPSIRSEAKRHADAKYILRKQWREAEKKLKDLIGSPAISGEILALIDWLEKWAGVDGPEGQCGADDRRQRILDLGRAFRAQQQRSEISPASQLGREMGRIAQHVEQECNRFRLNAGAENGDILAILPSYARILGFHVAHRALANARAKGNNVPATATRLLSLWPERADACWEKHRDWSMSQPATVAAELTKPWALAN